MVALAVVLYTAIRNSSHALKETTITLENGSIRYRLLSYTRS